MDFDADAYEVTDAGVKITGDGILLDGSPTGRYHWRCQRCQHAWAIRRPVVVDQPLR